MGAVSEDLFKFETNLLGNASAPDDAAPALTEDQDVAFTRAIFNSPIATFGTSFPKAHPSPEQTAEAKKHTDALLRRVGIIVH